jgi:predicted phage-related endonuclease
MRDLGGMRIVRCADREEWLAKRREFGIGGSDAPAVCGMSSYRTPFQLYWEKKGFDVVGDSDKNAAEKDAGNALEERVGQLFEKETGLVLLKPEPFTIIRHATNDGLFCTPDFFVVDGAEIAGILQAKTTRFWRKTWGDEMPEEWRLQALHERECCRGTDPGFQAYLAVLVSGVDFKWQLVSDPAGALLDILVTSEESFLEALANDDPPAPRDRDSRSVDKLYPVSEKRVVALDGMPEIPGLLTEYADIAPMVKKLEQRMELIKARLKLVLKEADEGVMSDGTRVVYRTISKKSFTKTYPATTYRSMTIRFATTEEDEE